MADRMTNRCSSVHGRRTLHRALLLLVGGFILGGCAQIRIPVQRSASLTQTPEVGVAREVPTGESIYSVGQVSMADGLEMSSGFAGTLPGSMFLPFDVVIEQQVLIHAFDTKSYRHYVGDYNRVNASHGMLGKVIVDGDSVGLRVSKQTGKQEWLVDNSRWGGVNEGKAFWKRSVKPSDGVEFTPVQIQLIDERSRFTQLEFTGVQRGQVMFLLHEVEKGQESTERFSFELLPESPTLVRLREHEFEVLQADATGVTYRWLSEPALIQPPASRMYRVVSAQ